MSRPRKDQLSKLLPKSDDVSTHLSLDELQRYVSGTADREERLITEVHLRACPLCAYDVADLSEQFRRETVELAEPKVTKATDSVPRRRWMWFVLPAFCGAAAMGIVTLVV